MKKKILKLKLRIQLKSSSFYLLLIHHEYKENEEIIKK